MVWKCPPMTKFEPGIAAAFPEGVTILCSTEED
jgi:hypothetical protein